MSMLSNVWAWVWAGLSHFFTADVVPALKDWAGQFATAAEQVALQDAAIYGPKILSGDIKITDAATQLEADLLTKGLTVSKEIILNALRTWANSAAMQTQAPVVPAGPVAPAVGAA